MADNKEFILGEGATGSVEGDTLIVKIDLKNNAGKTNSGNDSIAKVPGIAIPGSNGAKLQLNVYRVLPKS